MARLDPEHGSLIQRCKQSRATSFDPRTAVE